MYLEEGAYLPRHTKQVTAVPRRQLRSAQALPYSMCPGCCCLTTEGTVSFSYLASACHSAVEARKVGDIPGPGQPKFASRVGPPPWMLHV